MCYDREYVIRRSGEIDVLRVLFFLLAPTISYVRHSKCTANLHWVGMVIIEISSNLAPVQCCLRRRIQIEPGEGY